jgi:hypothetical protein
MIMVLHGTRQICGLLRVTNWLRTRSPEGGSPGSPDYCRSELHFGRTFATAAASRAGYIRRASRYDRPGTVWTLGMHGDNGGLRSVVHRRTVESGEGNPWVRW